MRFITFLLGILFSTISFAQNTIYLDESNQEIDSTIYKNKCIQHPFKCLEYITDSLILKKVLYKFNFGRLDEINYQKIRNTLVKDSKTETDTNAILIIHFYDSLRTFKTVYKEHLKHLKLTYNIKDSLKFKQNPKPFLSHDYDEEEFKKNRINFIKKNNKCIKTFESKYNTRLFYVYKDDSNISGDYVNFKWLADNGIFKNTFFEIMFNYWVVIIKPDGEYFLNGSHLSDKNISKLIESDDWSIYKKDWYETLEIYLINGKGLFKKESALNHKKHCF